MNLTQNYLDNLNKIVKYFIISIPLLLITGPFLADLIFSLIGLSFIFFFKNYQSHNVIKTFSKVFVLFYFIILLSSFFAEDKMLSLGNSIFYFRFFLFSITFFYILCLDETILKKIFLTLFLCYLILILDGFYQFYFKENILGFPLDSSANGRRVSSFFLDELIYGSYLTRLSPLFFGLIFFLFRNTNLINIIFLISVILIELAVFISGERTSFILFNVIVFLMLIFLSGFKNIRILIFATVPLIIIILLNISSPAKKRIVDQTLMELKSKNYDSELILINRQYHEHFVSSYNIFKDNKILGVGPKNFRIVCKDEKYNISKLTCSTHPHNTYLQLLSETGIFSFFIIFSLFLLLNFMLLKHLILKFFKKELLFNNFEICLIIHFYISLFPFTTSGSFFNNWVSILYFYPLPILLWLLKNKKII